MLETKQNVRMDGAGLAAATIYLACSFCKCPRSQYEVKGALSVDPKTFKKSIRYIEKTLGPRLRRNTYDWKVLGARDLYNRTVQQLGYSPEDETRLLRAIRRIDNNPNLDNLELQHKPSVKAALVIAVASSHCGLDI